MQGPKAEGDDEVVCDINITPLCDIFVVLLIIFMVTAELIVQSGPSVDLPQNSKASQQPSQIVVTMNHEGQYFLGDRQIPVDRQVRDGFAQFSKEIESEMAKAKQPLVMVRADKRILIRDVMRVVNLAVNAGAKEVAIATRLVEVTAQAGK